MTPLQPHLGDTRRHELRNSPFWPSSLFKPQLVKEEEDFLLRKDLTQSLGWIINQEKSKLKPAQVFSFVGYKYHLSSALVKPTQERWLKLQDLIIRLNGENGPGGMPSHKALPVSPQGALEISSVVGHPPSLDRNHCSTPRMVAKSHKCDERCRPSFQIPQYPTLYRCLKRRRGHSLRANLHKGSVVRQGKRGYT